MKRLFLTAALGAVCVSGFGQGTGQYQDFLYYTNNWDAPLSVTISGYTGGGESVVIPSSINGLPVTIIGNWAFASNGVAVVSIPASVCCIGDGAFLSPLFEVYFGGSPPGVGIQGLSIGMYSKVYYLPGTTGWDSLPPYWLQGGQLVLWNPVIQTADSSFGIQPGGFGFNISGTPDIPLATGVCTNLSAPEWVELQVYALTNSLVHFNDPEWTNYPARYYRVQWPVARVWITGRAALWP